MRQRRGGDYPQLLTSSGPSADIAASSITPDARLEDPTCTHLEEEEAEEEVPEGSI